VAGTTTPDATLNALRAYSGYLFYIGLVGVMDSPQRVKSVISIVFLLVAVSVGVQLLEAIQGERIITPFAPASEYFSGTKFVIGGGIKAPYLWNRATGYLFLGLFLALGALVSGKMDFKHLSLGSWAVVGVAIALVRQWFIMIGCGLVLLALLSHGKRLRAFGKSVAFGGLAVVAISLISEQVPSFPLLDALKARIGTILAFQQEPNYLGRVLIQRQMLALFSHSPVLGYGPGSGLVSSDVGVYNALVELGLVGAASIAYLIAFVLVRSYRRWKQMADSVFRAYLSGLLAAWGAMLIGYAFSTDFFGQMSMVVGLAMALMDRTCRFAAVKQKNQNEPRHIRWST
jgi:O-antigen ligase